MYKIAEKLLVAGSVGILPTDTLYGIVARASDSAAVERLYKLKSRSAKPGTIIAASVQQLMQLGLDPRQLNQAQKFWPGPVSVVLDVVNPTLKYLHQGLNTLACRVVELPELAELLQTTGPLITSSANMPGEPPANTTKEAGAYFGNLVDFYIDGGDLSGRSPSKIVVLGYAGKATIVR